MLNEANADFDKVRHLLLHTLTYCYMLNEANTAFDMVRPCVRAPVRVREGGRGVALCVRRLGRDAVSGWRAVCFRAADDAASGCLESAELAGVGSASCRERE